MVSLGNEIKLYLSFSDEKQKYLITYSDVIEGTRHFHQELKLGASAFAEVYCGKWGNRSFAVKVFKQVIIY